MNEATPYFLFKPSVLEKNYKEFERLCEKYIENYVIAYSVKTNSFGGVINTLDELRSNFEVASLYEIEKTTIKSKVFNGSCKTEEELRMAIDRKFLINVDSKSEVDKIVKILQGKDFNIGLRVSLTESKFGFEESELDEIIDYCKGKNLIIICLHFHGGTQKNLRHFNDHLRGVERIISKTFGKIKLRYIDIGGGFPDKFQLKNLNVSLEDYFKSIRNYLNKFNLKIILEPGRNLVSDAFDLITKVCVIKKNFGKSYAVLDVGINVLSKITLASHKFIKMDSTHSSHSKENNNEEYILAGPLLFNNDIVGRFNGYLDEGDLIKVENVGAYCYNLAWEISYSKPKILIEE